MIKSVEDLMNAAVARKVFPGAQLLVSRGATVLLNHAYGSTDIYTETPVCMNTFFDLASLTKPLATALATMLLLQKNRLHLSQPLGHLIPGFAGSTKADIQIRQLLNHSAGLPDYRPYYLSLRHLPPEKRKPELQHLILAEPLISPPGEKTLYSDIGFMILQWVLETVSETPLNDFVENEIYEPLGIKNLFFTASDPKAPLKSFAATEFCPWRQKVMRGQVHDENAFAMGGVAGHAGLFGNAGAVHAVLIELMKTFQGGSAAGIFHSELVRLFFRKNRKSGRALGFDTPSENGSSSGIFFTPDTTVGHLGFTGTSFWMDLKTQVIVILLTNRVHPSRANEGIRAFRPRLHNMVMQEFV